MSLQPIGKSKTIPSLEIDYEALGKEIKSAEQKRNTKEQKPTRVAKQTSGTLYANGANPYSIDKQQMINFLNKEDDPAPVVQTPADIDHTKAAKPAGNQKFAENPHMTSKNIMRSGAGTDNDSATPHRRSDQSEMINSIWDSEKVQRIANEFISTPGEQISKNKEDRQTVLKQLEIARRDQMADALQAGVDQRNASHVTHTGGTGGDESQYKMPSKNMSIFDTESFETYASEHLTDGEKLSAAKKAKANADKDLLNSGSITTSRGVLNRLWDALRQEGSNV